MYGHSGPKAVVNAWNGWGYDAEKRIAYLWGGGHFDYGGNEVYTYSYDTGLFARLTDPSALDPANNYRPLSGPRANHTYGGIVWSRLAKRLLVVLGQTGYMPPETGRQQWVGDAGDLWAFDPATRKWQFIDRLPGGMGAYRLSEMPDGRIFVSGAGNALGTPLKMFILNPANWSTTTATQWFETPYQSWSGGAAYDPARNVQWIPNSNGGVLQAGFNPNPFVRQIFWSVYGVDHEHTALMLHNGKVLAWNGRRELVRLDPDTKRREVHRFESGPEGVALMMNRALLINGKIVGMPSAEAGVWEVPVPAEGWVEIRSETAQSHVDAAQPGATVTIPPGFYAGGLVIAKPLTLNLKGVVLGALAEGKGAVVVKGVKAIINDLSVVGVRGDVSSAAVRAEGDFDIELNRFYAASVMNGILTGNTGGRLVVQDRSLIERIMGGESPAAHGIYFGRGREFILRDSTVLAKGGFFGHLVKSRALKTSVARNVLDGRGGHYSREIDVPCGGNPIIEDNTIIKGEGSVQENHVAYASEPNDCISNGVQLIDQPGTFTYRGNKFTTLKPAKTNFGYIKQKLNKTFVIQGNQLPSTMSWSSFPPGS